MLVNFTHILLDYFPRTGESIRLSQCQSSNTKDYGHDDVIKWKHFPRYWPFVWGIHRPKVNSPHKGQWRGALIFSLIYVWINGWVNNNEAGDLRRYRTHYDVMVIITTTKVKKKSRKHLVGYFVHVLNRLLVTHRQPAEPTKIHVRTSSKTPKPNKSTALSGTIHENIAPSTGYQLFTWIQINYANRRYIQHTSRHLVMICVLCFVRVLVQVIFTRTLQHCFIGTGGNHTMY